jgi:hypothetical protein
VSDAASFFGGLAKSLKRELSRSREALVPPGVSIPVEDHEIPGGLWRPSECEVVEHCARARHSRARRAPRILCAREIQGSIKESAHRLLCDQIELLGLADFLRDPGRLHHRPQWLAFLLRGTALQHLADSELRGHRSLLDRRGAERQRDVVGNDVDGPTKADHPPFTVSERSTPRLSACPSSRGR